MKSCLIVFALTAIYLPALASCALASPELREIEAGVSITYPYSALQHSYGEELRGGWGVKADSITRMRPLVRTPPHAVVGPAKINVSAHFKAGFSGVLFVPRDHAEEVLFVLKASYTDKELGVITHHELFRLFDLHRVVTVYADEETQSLVAPMSDESMQIDMSFLASEFDDLVVEISHIKSGASVSITQIEVTLLAAGERWH